MWFYIWCSIKMEGRRCKLHLSMRIKLVEIDLIKLLITCYVVGVEEKY